MSIVLAVFDLESAAIVEDHDDRIREVFGISEAFRRLHAMGILVAVNASMGRPVADAIVGRLQWNARALVDAVVTIDDVEVDSPLPATVHAAMRMLRVQDASRVVKVSNRTTGLLQGTAAGCAFTVGVENRADPASPFARHARAHVVATAAILPELIQRFERQRSVARPCYRDRRELSPTLDLH